MTRQKLEGIERLTIEIRERNIKLGWRHPENTFGDYIALLHSEVTEMVEAYRDYRLADATKPPEPIYRDEEIPKVRKSDTYATKRVVVGYRLPKPEGVGSEIADVIIRLLDMCDVFGLVIGNTGQPYPTPATLPRTFGDWCAHLHQRISKAYELYELDECLSTYFDLRNALEGILDAVLHVSDLWGLDVNAEVARKMAYNATRPYRHGRGTLASDRSELG